MGRAKRAADGGLVYHVLNRSNARLPIFENDRDYAAFEQVLEQAVARHQTRLLAYCVLKDHWHLVVWPREDGELSRFTGWLTLTHTRRRHVQHQTTGSGHVYQGRFKSFPVQENQYFYSVCRYVERNPLRANLVESAERWRFSSLHRRYAGTTQEKALLADGPLPFPTDWLELIGVPPSETELAALRRCVARGCPYGDPAWSNRMVARLGLESTVRPQGRPRKIRVNS